MAQAVAKMYPTPTERLQELEEKFEALEVRYQRLLTAYTRITERAFRLACRDEVEQDLAAYKELKHRLAVNS